MCLWKIIAGLRSVVYKDIIVRSPRRTIVIIIIVVLPHCFIPLPNWERINTFLKADDLMKVPCMQISHLSSLFTLCFSATVHRSVFTFPNFLSWSPIFLLVSGHLLPIILQPLLVVLLISWLFQFTHSVLLIII